MAVAFTFPGQGSQSVGMLAALARAHGEVEQTFAEASEVLGYDLWRLVQEGPASRLNATEQTQPAMLAAGVAVWRAWRALGGRAPDIAAGHSLGEYSALVCADSLDFPDAVRLVAARGRFMQEAVPEGEGAIAALLGLDDDRVTGLCEVATGSRDGRIVSAVNFNAPGQVVVAGHADAVEEVLELAREAGARRAVALPMSVPVHCELMLPASERLGDELAGVALRAPRLPVVHNADNEVHDDPEAIRDALSRQLYTPVRWAEAVQSLERRGATTLVEPGPGRVLTGLAKRIDRSLDAVAVHDDASLEAALGKIRDTP